MKDALYPIRLLHGKLNEKRLFLRERRKYAKEYKKNPDTVFLLLTPEHGNIGDHGIAFAETTLISNAGLNYIEITGHKLEEYRKRKWLCLFNGFPILFNGGGYLGTIWPEGEGLLQQTIHSNPKSRIVCLPNTIYYSRDENGRLLFEQSKRIYNHHKHMFLYAREKASYQIMKNAYHNVKLVPDMVLSLNHVCSKHNTRNGCLLCLRSDREKTRTEGQDKTIALQATQLFGDNVLITDMIEGKHIPVKDREKALQEKFDQFSASELVITDRLHGMIFAAITGTPCIVVDSKSPKVRGCYEWIKDLDYIRFADDVSEIADEYSKIPKGEHHYDNSHLMHYYDELVEDIRNVLLKGKRKCR